MSDALARSMTSHKHYTIVLVGFLTQKVPTTTLLNIGTGMAPWASHPNYAMTTTRSLASSLMKKIKIKTSC